ncbi:MAG: tRNA epoxyqueuosine(34) reductase QueG [bacterium]
MGNRGGLKEFLKALALKAGAASCAITDAGLSGIFPGLSRVPDCGLPPGLSYLSRESEKRADIRKWFPPAESVLVCAFQYWNSSMKPADFQPAPGQIAEFLKGERRRFNRKITPEYGSAIARYALSEDYHETIRDVLREILKKASGFCPGISGKIFVDTSPVMEKPFARAAGLGWQGKNTLLISEKRGSWFFIGGMALSGKMDPDPPAENRCGTCDLCLRACPTGALREPGVLDPNLCLSYWTTQHKGDIPPEIIKRMEGKIYGCDICQEVCPYNSDVIAEVRPEFHPLLT